MLAAAAAVAEEIEIIAIEGGNLRSKTNNGNRPLGKKADIALLIAWLISLVLTYLRFTNVVIYRAEDLASFGGEINPLTEIPLPAIFAGSFNGIRLRATSGPYTARIASSRFPEPFVCASLTLLFENLNAISGYPIM